MKYVYLLRSISDPRHTYVGLTDDPKRRLEKHNKGKSPHTSKYRPWEIEVAIRFDDEKKAALFERYLKSGSGHAFANRHFWSWRMCRVARAPLAHSIPPASTLLRDQPLGRNISESSTVFPAGSCGRRGQMIHAMGHASLKKIRESES